MKKLIMILLFISAAPLYPQNPDLILNTSVSEEYADYLNNELIKCNQIINNPTSDPVVLNAYARRFFINFSLIHCEIVTTLNEEKIIIDSIKANNKRLEAFYRSNIQPLNTKNCKLFFNGLLELFKDPRYGRLKSEITVMASNYLYELMFLGYYSLNLIEDIDKKMQQVSDDFYILTNNTVNFSIILKIEGSKTDEKLVLTQNHFKTAGKIDSLFENSSKLFREALKQLVQVQNGEIQASEMIGTLKESIDYFSEGLDTILQLINSHPLSLLKLNTWWITDAKDFLSRTTELLNGKTYIIGSDNIKIRPVALLENPVGNWSNILLNFYRSANRYGYTFANLFPEALPPAVVDKLKEDMVLNSTDGVDVIYSRMQGLKNEYLNILAQGQGNSSTELGAALTQAYLYMNDLPQEILSFVGYILAGDYRTAFPFSIINNKEVQDSISGFYNKACEDPELLFTILIVNEKQSQPYRIGTETDLMPIFITNPMAISVRNTAREMANTMKDIKEFFNRIYNDMDNMFDMSLDPNYLDFSSARTPFDIILVLEKSNPHFMDITPYGIEQFQKMRTDIRNKLSKYAGCMNSLNQFLDSLSFYRNEYKIDEMEFRHVIFGSNAFMQQMNTDFQEPDSVTVINGIKVNLSAWFDNPPQNLLLRLKWFFDKLEETDNTLGGLFPEGITEIFNREYPLVPTEYSLSQNYPNPFNPTTTINYSVPHRAFVILKVYDVLGKEVAVLIRGEKNPGNYSVEFNAGGLTSGIYLYRMQADEFTATKKLILLK